MKKRQATSVLGNDEMTRYIVTGIALLILPTVTHANWVHNGGFDRLWGWNQRDTGQSSTPYAGWAWRGAGCKPEATPGEISLSAPGVLSSLPAAAWPVREYILFFDVKTVEADGFATFSVQGRTLQERDQPAPLDAPWSFGEFLDGERKPIPAKYRQTATQSPSLALPKNTGGKFVTLTTVASFKPEESLPTEVNVLFSIDLHKGSCTVDNVRIEAAPGDSVFRPARNEWLTVEVVGVADNNLPSFAGAGLRIFRIVNTSGVALSGMLTLAIDTWRTPGQGAVWSETRELDALAPGECAAFEFEPGKFSPDAYVATAVLEVDGKKVVDVSSDSLPLGQKVLSEGYNVLCFSVYPDIKPAKMFGVGNSMLRHQFPGDVAVARELGLVSTWIKGLIGAAYGTPSLDSETIDQFPPIFHQSLLGADPALKAFLNPLNPNMLDIFTPEGRAEIVRRGEVYGKDRLDFPGIYALRLNNEKAYFNRNTHCPSAAADANFREWCKDRHGSLENLNLRWGTQYQSWNEVEQVISAKMIDLAKASYQQKTGAEAIDWKASSSFLKGEGYEKQLRKNWGQTLDWMRWTTASTLWLYSTFTEAARKHDPDTIYGNCFCWPNFWPAVVMPHIRAAQSAQLDIQYCAGFDGGAHHDRHLGNNDEMLDALEMIESVIPGKPIVGNEVYVQPAYAADYPALQNWGLVAHGMNNILLFGWRPFSDHGYKVFFDEEKKQPVTRYWERPDSIACWMLFDTDGTKLPVYDSVAVSSHEISDFHQKYDFWSIKRLSSRIGWYLSNDSSELVVPITANRPWDNPILTSRFTLSSFLRRAGVTMNYLDDADLERMTPAHFDTIIVPPAPVLSDEAAESLAAFAQAGGQLVVIGPTGIYDPWINRHPNYGGKPWREINRDWTVPERWSDPDMLMGDMIAYPVPEVGTGLRPLSPKQNEAKAKFAEKQLMTMTETVFPGGETIADFATRRTWGKGEIVAVSTFPQRRTQMPYPTPELRAYMTRFIQTLGLPQSGYFRLDGEVPTDNHEQLLGHGVPEVEVVVRKKDNGDLFVFVLNCGGAGSGRVVLPGSATQVFDALNGENPVEFQQADADTVIPVNLSPWGYRVLRVAGY